MPPKTPPDFAGHFNYAIWGFGSNYAAGAIIDIHTGIVYPPPGKSGNESGWDRWIFTLGIVEGNPPKPQDGSQRRPLQRQNHRSRAPRAF